MANIWDRQQHPHFTDAESEALVLWKSIFQTKQHPESCTAKLYLSPVGMDQRECFAKSGPILQFLTTYIV